MRSLIAERMNKVFRENLEFLFDRFESQDLCAIVVSSTFAIFIQIIRHVYESDNKHSIWLQELEKLVDILKHAHELLSKDLTIDSFSLMLNEMQENISLVSFSSRLASQVWKIFFLSLSLLDLFCLELSSLCYSMCLYL